MAWIPTNEEIKSVLALDGAKRYAYCVKKVADQQRLWGLWQEGGWALTTDDSGHELVPVWPHEKFALACANEIWSGYQPKAIDVDVWFERWTPGMEKDARWVAVFPTPHGNGVVVEPRRFEVDLHKELSQYE